MSRAAMRRVVVPRVAIEQLLADGPGASVEVPVVVDWPELQLTERQRDANLIAHLKGEVEPYPDPALFSVVLPRVSVPRPSRPLPGSLCPVCWRGVGEEPRGDCGRFHWPERALP